VVEISKKLLLPLKEGDDVCIDVSQLDKGRRDPGNLIGVVMNIDDEKYKVATRN